MWAIAQRLFAALGLGLLLGACGPLVPGSAGNNQPVSLGRAQFEAPDQVVTRFLDAWNQRDLEAMYALVSQPSRERYLFTTFEARYTVVQDATRLEGVTYTLRDTRIQGLSAAITYDATLNSPIFGTIDDPDRIMRLVQTEEGWRIAWTPMDIIDGLTSEVQIQVQSRFPQRANIYDRNDRVLVEQNGTIVVISVIKQDMRDVEQCIDLLANVMQRSRAGLARLFANYNPDTFFQVGEMDPEVYFARRAELDPTCALDVSANFNKVAQYQNRRYFGHGAATHVTGYIGRIPANDVPVWQTRGYQESDLIGRAAIEAAYEETLAGKPERFLRMIEPGGAVLRELGGAIGAEPTPIRLTIDRDLQFAVAQALADAFNYAAANWASVAGGAGAIVIDVNSGAILALASYPTFDPSLFNPSTSYQNPLDQLQTISNDPRRPLSNKVVQEQYTPGSIYKVLTTIAAAAENVYSPSEIFNCDLEWTAGPEYGDTVRVRQDWRVSDGMDAAGPLFMAQALMTSCNPFFWEMGGLLYRRDPNLLAQYSERFGLGARTGVFGLGPEAMGSVARPTSATEAINNAIGQGSVQVTALQMAMAVATIANGGQVWQPYVVAQVGGIDEGTEAQTINAPVLLRTVNLSDDVWQVVREGMCGVPIDSTFGTAISSFGDAPFTSCGKTGTAEAGARGSGVPPHAWYVSFAPRENPQIATVVVVPNSREGSEVAAPITRRILDFYFNVSPKPYPDWWAGEYVPLEAPQGVG